MSDAPALFPNRPGSVGGGRFVLQGRLGSGGVAEVFRAIDTELQVDCAVKLLECGGSAVAERFVAEGRAMQGIRHPNVPRVLATGSEGTTPWIAMELAGGGSLARRIQQRGPFDPEEALRLTFEVLQALAAVHAAGLVHRDVKPENVLLDDAGHALLADFGVARHPDGGGPAFTRPGETLGTRGYRAPEQEGAAHEVLPTADLYGVSATVFAMVVGRAPARAWDADDAIPDQVDRPIAELIARGTSADPSSRFPDARAMAESVAGITDAYRAMRGAPPVSTEWLARFDALLTPPPAGPERWLPGPLRALWSRRWR